MVTENLTIAPYTELDETKGCTTGCEGCNTWVPEVVIGTETAADDMFEVTAPLGPDLACCETVCSVPY